MTINTLTDWIPGPRLVTRAPIPAEADWAVDIARDDEVHPGEVGLDPDAVEAVWESVRTVYRSGIHPAISLCVRREGQVLLKRALGYRSGAGPDADPADLSRAEPCTVETPFNIYSASKPVTAMVTHLLDQRNLIHLDDPVCRYIPEFAAHGKRWITIRHILVHRAGFPSLPPDALDLENLRDPDNAEPVRILCDAEPDWGAGRRLAYHALSGGFILGEIARRVTGRGIREFLRDEIAEPLGWRWMSYGVAAADVDKVAVNYVTGLPPFPPLSGVIARALGVSLDDAVRLSNDRRFLEGVLPAGNVVTTADEASQFYELLLEGGELGGVRIFEPRTVWRAVSEQTYGEFDYTLAVPIRYGLGFMLGADYVSLFGPDTRYAFGHLGFTNVVCWADPMRKLTVALMTSGKPVVYPELPSLFSVAMALQRACPKIEGAAERPYAGM